VDTQNIALATTFNEQQLQELPTPGGDVTTVAFTLPGVVVNAGGAYGNFSSNGLPGISNLFVLNGFDNQDPFLNLNNSGSSNLTLGQGELAEATVIQNGYNSEYGRAAGAVINYTTKSGSNAFHGAADYDYNGTVLNANGWFNSFQGQARPHAVSNQWAANVGGPIIKDKVFFFADYEGLRYVLPGSSGYLTFPSPELETYITQTVPADAQSLRTCGFPQVFRLRKSDSGCRWIITQSRQHRRHEQPLNWPARRAGLRSCLGRRSQWHTGPGWRHLRRGHPLPLGRYRQCQQHQ
jgi:hypothetical protein